MKETSKRVILLAMLVLGVLIAVCAYAEHQHNYVQGLEWKHDENIHWQEAYDRCKCGKKNPNPRVVLVPTPFGYHNPSTPKYNKSMKKDVITCTVCGRVMEKRDHKHRYTKTEKVTSAKRINTAQHVAYITVTYKCECGASNTTNTSRTESHNPLHGYCSRCKTTN